MGSARVVVRVLTEELGDRVRGFAEESRTSIVEECSGTWAIVGEYADVCKARDAILEMGRSRTDTLLLEKDVFVRVVGRKGQSLEQIMENSGARIHSGRQLKQDNKSSGAKTLIVEGSVQQVEAAEHLIGEIGCASKQWTLSAACDNADSWQVKFLFQKGIRFVEAIESKASCKVGFSDQTITITSSDPADAELGKRLVESVLNNLKRLEHPLAAPKIKIIMAKSGLVLSRIQTISGAVIDVNDGCACLYGLDAQVRRARDLLVEAADSEKERIFSIDQLQVGLLLGKAGARVAKIQSTSGARVHLDDSSNNRRTSADEDPVDTIVSVSGISEKVEVAMTMINELLSTQTFLKVHVADDGKWKNLMVRSSTISLPEGVRMSLRRQSNTIAIIGNPVDVDAAKQMVDECLDVSSRKLELSHSSIRAIIGKKGSRVLSFEKKTGASIFGEKGVPQLTLMGTSTQIAAAELCIKEYLESEETSSVTVPEYALATLVGRQGSTIKNIEQETGTRIVVARDTCEATVKGSSSQRSHAEKMIQEIVEASMVAEFVSVTEWEKLVLIGPGRTAADSFEEKTGVHLSIDSTGSQCCLRGTYDAVQKAIPVLAEYRSLIRHVVVDLPQSQSPEDEISRLTNGPDSRLRRFEKDNGVCIFTDVSDSFYDPVYHVSMGGLVANDADWDRLIVRLKSELENSQ